MTRIVFFDIETDRLGEKVFDIGAVSNGTDEFHSPVKEKFQSFLENTDYLCGHNVFEHDLKYVREIIRQSPVRKFIDTLFLSPLLFPSKPYHRIGKNYKIVSEEELNNPLFDSRLARVLFEEEVAAFEELDEKLKAIYYSLLFDKREFRDFFHYLSYSSDEDCQLNIKKYFYGKICENVDYSKILLESPVELAYSLALINAKKKESITPPWILRHYPRVENILYLLRSNRCIEGCKYCNDEISPKVALKKIFNFDSFKTYEGEPLQEKAATAAIDGKSLLAIFPTGGGKSITFQLPALVQGQAVRGLTVVLSPLQSLMKDQVDNLEHKGITSAVTINGALDPIERAKAYERVEDGSASILYIAPESLRSRSVETLLLKRNVVRFVIDEAHCFSSWGQDFRVDYLYIGDFISKYQKKKNLKENIPVSCFTATAKQMVIEDITQYFREKLSLDLALFRSGAQRTNLEYFVINEQGGEEKYQRLRTLLNSQDEPTIVYVSRTRRAEQISKRLNQDGLVGGSVPYHGQLDRQVRIENQEKFMRGEVRVIVATTAFGMGVDKDNVGVVIHFDISTSIEDYVQEAGRAGRDEKIKAKCFILFDGEQDLNSHFILLNQTKISIKEIQQVWKAIREVTRLRSTVSRSALEIARDAGWDDGVEQIETRVRTAIAALEQAGFMKRGQNMPSVFANSILAKNMQEAVDRINASSHFSSDKDKQMAIRIMKSLISSKHRTKGINDDAETRVDYLADILGVEKDLVVRIVNILREEGLLADVKDLLAYIKRKGRVNTSLTILTEYSRIERGVINDLPEEEGRINLKEINKNLEIDVPNISIQKIKTVLNFYDIKNLIKRAGSGIKDVLVVKTNYKKTDLMRNYEKRLALSGFIIKYLYQKSLYKKTDNSNEELDVGFSCLELKVEYEKGDLLGSETSFEEIDDALYYLSKIGALRLEGAFLLIYNAMQIERTEESYGRAYRKGDYKQLEEYYKNKIQQIHIVGEYAKLMAKEYKEALQFVDDYFKLNYDSFIRKYFKGREPEINQNITSQKFKELFGDLSPRQLSIINDAKSKYIVVAAGPGSGKTKVLVHKLASLYMLEDVKHEQMLMLTFSRAAATEFKKKLMSPTMLGQSAHYIQINTFHSYCFDLLGRIGTLGDSDTIILEAVRRIKESEIETNKITKTVLVIDEAQDMSETEFSLVKALMEVNEDMRVIAVGDDDQNIYEFRHSDSRYLRSLIEDYEATKYDLLDNYRSRQNIVNLANTFVKTIKNRLKEAPINAIQNLAGEVSITKYRSSNLSVPVVNDILNKELSGSICVLTETNDDAATIAGLLTKNGVSARLIQDSSGFNLENLEEIRFFVEALGLREDTYLIDSTTWSNAKEKMEKVYAESTAYEYAKILIKDFEEMNSVVKYKSDFLQFILESKLEDFHTTQSSQVVVSTIHKAKGREFDNVFLVFTQDPKTDEKKRAIYVALTRAKNNLYIHCRANCFNGMKIDGVSKFVDDFNYEEPPEIVLPISFRGVHLSSFYKYKKYVSQLQSGDVLQIKSTSIERNGEASLKYFGYSESGKEVLRFSDATCARIEELVKKGYIAKFATVRLVVWWKEIREDGKERPETKIVLPDIHFTKE